MTALLALFVHEGFGVEEVGIHETGEEQADQGLRLLCRTDFLSKLSERTLSRRSILFSPALDFRPKISEGFRCLLTAIFAVYFLKLIP